MEDQLHSPGSDNADYAFDIEEVDVEDKKTHKEHVCADFEDEGATIPDEVLAIDATSDEEVYLSPTDTMRQLLQQKKAQSGKNMDTFTYASDAQDVASELILENNESSRKI